MPPAPTTIPCPSCSHINEPTRVFCHNCGVRLPRDEALLQQVASNNQAAATKAGQVRRGEFRAQRASIDWSGLAASAVASLIKLTLLAALAAAIILAVRTPPELPSPVAKDPAVVQRGDAQLETYLEPTVKGTLTASINEVNTYLQSKIQLTSQVHLIAAQSEPATPFIQLGSQQFTLGNRFSVLGFPMTIRTTFLVQSTGGGSPRLVIAGSYLGSLPLPLVLFRFLPPWYAPIEESLRPQLDALARAREVEITPELVRVHW